MKSVIQDSEVSFLPFHSVGDISGVFPGSQLFERANESYDSTDIHRFVAVRVDESSYRLEFKGTQHYCSIIWDLSYLRILLEY